MAVRRCRLSHVDQNAWFLARDPAMGLAFVNVASGGQVTEIDLDAFLSGPRNHEQDALLRLIGTLILDPHGAVMTDSPTWIPAGSGGMRSCASLGDMLPRGLSIEEVARLLLRGLPRSARRGGRPSLPVAGGPIRQALVSAIRDSQRGRIANMSIAP